ncbi:MAG: DNA primase DnaG [Candidatus Bilamarchaeaceae archaeon]
MAKTYIDTVKYLIYADVEVDGTVDKPDVVGAIFGQTEGLLGEELDLRDLQKNGRIGRIEVDLRPKGGKTTGMVKIPSSLDMVETCIIGAAIETVERVGPCEAKITIGKVEDTRSIKREKLVERSKELLRTLINTEIPESQEISDMVREEVKAAEISTYGKDRLPAGPGIGKAETVILVEGRADVVNLLKKDLPNVVAIGGAKVTQTILDLTREKEITVFLDGDRGGDMILRELAQAGADIDFVARAPTGKEVEELTRKEIMKCLKNKIPFEQESGKGVVPIPSQRNEVMPHTYQEAREEYDRRRRQYEQRQLAQRPAQQRREEWEQHARERADMGERPAARSEEKPEVHAEIKGELAPEEKVILEAEVQKPAAVEESAGRQEVPSQESKKVTREELENELKALSKTLKARFYDSGFTLMKELPVRDVIKTLEEVQGIHAIVFDGIVTQRLVDLAESKGVAVLVGGKMGNVAKKPAKLELIIPSSK